MLLGLFEYNDRSVQYQSAKLLALLTEQRPSEVVTGLLQSPLGIPKLVELLEGPDMVRNGIYGSQQGLNRSLEVLLLLKSLTATQNTEIQKIVAFADAFPRLFDIMQAEGMGNGSMFF